MKMCCGEGSESGISPIEGVNGTACLDGALVQQDCLVVAEHVVLVAEGVVSVVELQEVCL